MKANETRVEDFLSSNKTQFVIPVYQRNYDWTMEPPLSCRMLKKLKPSLFVVFNYGC